MTIIWCGGEDIDFPNWDTVGSSSSGSRTDYSRVSIGASSAVVVSTTFQPLTSAWLHLWQGQATGLTTWSDRPFFGLINYSTGSRKGIYITGDDATSNVKIKTYDGSSYSTLVTGTGNFFSTPLGSYDLHIADFGVSSTIRLYKNRNLVVEFTGDSSISGISNLNAVLLVEYTSGYIPLFSEIIVADVDTRLMSLKTLAPNAAGDTNEWDSGSYTDIDETTASSDVIATEGVEDNFQCNLTGMPSGTFKVKAVKVAASSADDAAQMGLKLGVKTNSAVHLGPAHSLTPSWVTLEKIFQTNPETASVFTSGEIDSLQLALRTDSTTTTTV
jgi:hypothetical protein